MAATADLTLAEISAQIIDEDVSDYVAAMEALPSGVATAEFLGKFLMGCYRAQTVKNAANTTAVAGELLNSYPAPTTGTVQVDAATGIQSFSSTYQVNLVSAANQDLTVPAYA